MDLCDINVKILLLLLELTIPLPMIMNVRIKNDGLRNIIVFITNSPHINGQSNQSDDFNLNLNAARTEKRRSFILFW
jgi:hypothetical protein